MSSKVSLDKSHADSLEDIENGLEPPLNRVLTIPVMIDGRTCEAIIYIGVSSFDFNSDVGAADILDIARRLQVVD